MTLADLFPDEDYGFRMRFERGRVAEFFGRSARHDDLIAQRRGWLRNGAQTYCALLTEGIPLLQETIELARSEQTLPPNSRREDFHNSDPLQNCLSLGIAWEPDFLLLGREKGGDIRLLGGCVCFPSFWSLEEKMGRPIGAIHGIVPGLNQAIGDQIHAFLSGLRPGSAWLRANWGLTRSPELNQHPLRKLAALYSGVSLEEVWLRIERQALVALPRTKGVLFGIRLEVHPLEWVKQDPLIARRLCRALRTMPGAVAQYKAIASARERLLELLAG